MSVMSKALQQAGLVTKEQAAEAQNQTQNQTKIHSSTPSTTSFDQFVVLHRCNCCGFVDNVPMKKEETGDQVPLLVPKSPVNHCKRCNQTSLQPLQSYAQKTAHVLFRKTFDGEVVKKIRELHINVPWSALTLKQTEGKTKQDRHPRRQVSRYKGKFASGEVLSRDEVFQMCMQDAKQNNPVLVVDELTIS